MCVSGEHLQRPQHGVHGQLHRNAGELLDSDVIPAPGRLLDDISTDVRCVTLHQQKIVSFTSFITKEMKCGLDKRKSLNCHKLSALCVGQMCASRRSVHEHFNSTVSDETKAINKTGSINNIIKHKVKSNLG